MCDLKDALQRGNAPQVLDVRTPREWDSGHIEGARHIPLAKLAGDLNQLHKGASLAVICGSGYRSSIAASLLLARGFAGVQNVMSGWRHIRQPNASSGKRRIWCSDRRVEHSFDLRGHRFQSLWLGSQPSGDFILIEQWDDPGYRE